MNTAALEVVFPEPVEVDGLLLQPQSPRLPAAGRVIVTMEATGVSFAEQQMRRGRYYDQPAFPFVPGYDVVGIVSAVGAGVAASLIGTRVAAVTMTGGWASEVEVDATDLLPVPDGVDPAEVEALLVNGITAWQMLHNVAHVRPGSTIVVLGANGGVGNVLVQLAVHAGARVVATASAHHHNALGALGVSAVIDYHDDDAYDQLRAALPGGADAVFDHVGGNQLVESWRLLARGGTLVSYGSAATKNDTGNAKAPLYRSFARVVLWNAMPNGKSAHLYNFWDGRRRRHLFIERQRAAFSAVLSLLRTGDVRPTIAARFALKDTVDALRLAESRTVAGKIVLVADHRQGR